MLQEALGEDVVEALDAQLRPRWVGCRLVLTHGSTVARGERAHGAVVGDPRPPWVRRGHVSGRLMAHQVLGLGQRAL